MIDDMRITALASWYGSNRMLGAYVGKALAGCSWVGIPFAGGMAEVPHIKASTLVVNDLHRHVINLASVCADERLGPKLYRRLRRCEFSESCLQNAREFCLGVEEQTAIVSGDDARLWEMFISEWAFAYFVACWMNRSAKAGTDDEFKGKLPVRWSASGGDSALRFHNAVLGIPAWRRTLRRCNFTCMDFREFLDKCKDEATSGIYCDPPFFDAGDEYKHKFTQRDHQDLHDRLAGFQKARVVIRYYDHPKAQKLYPQQGLWHWTRLPGGRTQANNDAPEVLITNWGWNRI